jgi:mannose-6-phosphate isomerase-like protein (cupin superfamily)
MRTILLAVMAASILGAQERHVDPTWLHRKLDTAPEFTTALTMRECRYHALFGAGDKYENLPKSVARYGLLTLTAKRECDQARFEREEQVYVVLEGTGQLRYSVQSFPIKRHDFIYLPAGVQHGLVADESLRVIWMGFRLAEGADIERPSKPLMANIDDVKLQVVGNHPPSTQYRLLMGDTRSKRDRIAAGLTLTSLFVMEFAPGGTNFPHHHEHEEEIYLVLDGTGEMVAGGGMDGVEGRHPAGPGDAYFFRANCTVGFYAGDQPARILAVRSNVPGRRSR